MEESKTLLDIPNNTWVRLKNGEIILFDHIDGMYSYCTTMEGAVIHLRFDTEVEVLTKKEIQELGN